MKFFGNQVLRLIFNLDEFMSKQFLVSNFIMNKLHKSLCVVY